MTRRQRFTCRWLAPAAAPHPRFFAPDQKTPGQEQKPWVQGDVWARPDNDGVLIFTEAVWVEDGVLKAGRRMDAEMANGRYRAEITGYFERQRSN